MVNCERPRCPLLPSPSHLGESFPSSSFVRLSGTTKAGIHTDFGGIRPMSQPTNYLVLVCLKVILQINEISLHPGFSTLSINAVS